MTKIDKVLLFAVGSLLLAVTALSMDLASCRKQLAEVSIEAEAANHRVIRITYEEYREHLESGEAFILEASRISCKHCALTGYVLEDACDGRLPVYQLDMEPLRDTEKYDEIKKEFGMDFVPSFFYIENGNIKLRMNNPIPGGYEDVSANEDRTRIRQEGLDKINAFIDGAIGVSEPINEALYAEVVTGD